MLQGAYKPIAEWKWTNYEGKRHFESLDQFVLENKDNYFFIGSDSQNYKKSRQCVFTTVVIAYTRGRGGRVALHKNKIGYMDNLRQRLLMEAMRSLEVAWYMDKLIPRESIIGIHLDVNQNLKFKSGKYKDELIGLIVGQGFKALVKPDSWAASTVADSRC